MYRVRVIIGGGDITMSFIIVYTVFWLCRRSR